DLFGGQACDEPQGEGQACLGRKDRMAGDEHEAQQVVADGLCQRPVELRRRCGCGERLALEFAVLALEQLSSPKLIERAIPRRAHSTASSMDFTCQSQKPAMSSLVSEKGPSVTIFLPSAKRTRLAFELGWSPSPANNTPAFTNSSLYFPISVRSCSLGITPASLSLVALTKIMNRIVITPSGWFRVRSWASGRTRLGMNPGSTDTTNEAARNRHVG